MEQHGISKAELERSLIDDDETHSFQLRIDLDSPTETAKKIAEYDPRRPQGSKWMLVSVNGEKPSASDIKNFDESHNHRDATVPKLRRASLQKETEEELQVRFSFLPESLPKKYEYLANVVGVAHINKNLKAIEKIVFTNSDSFRYKLLSIDHMKVLLTYENQNGQHFLTGEDITIKSTIMFKEIHIQDLQEYHNYKRVK